MRTHANEWTTSYLLIHDADINDSGVYICAPTSGGRTSIKVHVFLHGNKMPRHTHTQHVAITSIHTIPSNQFLLLIPRTTFPCTTNILFKQTRNFCLFFSQAIIVPNAFILFFYLGERPEAMQTGTSTYSTSNNIVQTILISIIISTYNLFQNYYTNILFSSRIPNEIT